MRPLVFLFALVTAAVAQSGGDKPAPPPPAPPKPGEGPPLHREGEHRGPPGMMPGMGKPQRGFDGFDRLSDAEKRKVRAAFEKAWQRAEVMESRNKAMRANEEMRHTLHQALKEIDPEVVGILEKIKPPFPMDQRGLPEMPRPESPEFARMAVARLGAEMASGSKPERREDTRRFHDRLMETPRLKEAFARLEQLPPIERLAGFQRFREVYRQVAGEEFKKFRERGGDPKDGGFRRPPSEPENKPGPPLEKP